MWRGPTGGVLVLGLGVLVSWLLRRGRRGPAVREVLFFPSRVTCVEALFAQTVGENLSPQCACPLSHDESALGRLVASLLMARHTLELCIFAFSSPQLGRAVLLLYERGVRVRVVTDTDYMVLAGSQIGRLRKAGIEVRHDQDEGYMHHKFAIVDRKVMITGSLNWTTQAIQSNRENVLIIEDPDCVKVFLAEFEKLWENYNPCNYIFFPIEEKQVPKKNKTSSLGIEKPLHK